MDFRCGTRLDRHFRAGYRREHTHDKAGQDTMTTAVTNRIEGAEALRTIRDGALLIDVRSEAGRHRDGEIHEAVVVPKTDVVSFVTNRIARRNPDQKIVIFCTSVKGSQPIVEKLTEAGVDNVFDVEGGFAAITGEDGLARIARPTPQA